MKLLVAALLSSFVFLNTSVSDQNKFNPGDKPDGFDRYLKENKDKNFKIKVPILKNKNSSLHEIKPGTHSDEIRIRSAMYRLKQQCNMRLQPQPSAKLLGVLPRDRKLWIEHHDYYWSKVFRKNGVGFIPRHCF